MNKPKKKDKLEDEGAALCPECGSRMLEEDGELVCPKCDGEINFFGEDDDD